MNTTTLSPPTHADADVTATDEATRAAVLANRQAGHRAREAAHAAGVSEGEAIQAFCGEHAQGPKAVPLAAEWIAIVQGLQACGPVMALTRNDAAVHEKHGTYQKASGSGDMGLVLGEDIDLRLFFAHWHAGYAVQESAAQPGHPPALSLQFFDAQGTAVHKVFAREHTDRAQWQALVDRTARPGQRARFRPLHAPQEPASPDTPPADAGVDREALRDGWASLRDTHEFFGLLRRSGASRQQAFRLVEGEFTERLPVRAVQMLLEEAAVEDLPIMVFVGSAGCIQIHTGPVRRIERLDTPQSRWLNVLDPGFNLHLREDQVAEVWHVVKPTADGTVTSVELFDGRGELVAMFFGARKPGQPERAAWRDLAARLPRLTPAPQATCGVPA